MSFLKESLKEFDHVVWPTRAETSRYFSVVVSVIAVFAVFLFAVGTAFSTSLFAVRNAVVPPAPAQVESQQTPGVPSDLDLNALLGSGALSETGESASTGAVAPSVSGEATAK